MGTMGLLHAWAPQQGSSETHTLSGALWSLSLAACLPSVVLSAVVPMKETPQPLPTRCMTCLHDKNACPWLGLACLPSLCMFRMSLPSL